MNPNKNKAAIYARFSPGADREKSSTIEAQIAMCRQKAEADGFSVDEEDIYIDSSVSAASTDRPAFQQMLANIYQRQFPARLYVKDDKRLFRNVKEALVITEDIWQHEVEIHFCLADTGDPRQSDANWFMGIQFQVYAEMERRRKARETYEHQKQNALAGFSNGGLPPYGYQRQKVEITGATGIKKEKLSWQINPSTAPAVALSFELHQQGTSCRQIAEILNQQGYRTQKDNLFSGATVASWFRNPFPFAGVMIWGRHNKKRQVTAEEEWVQQPQSYPGIISLELAQQVYQAHKTKDKKPAYRGSKYLLTGLMKCAHCGQRFVSHTNLKKKQYYYVCGYRNRRKSSCCNHLWVQMKRIEQQLRTEIDDYILADGFLESYLKACLTDSGSDQPTQAELIKSRQQQLQQCKVRIDNLVSALADQTLPQQEIINRLQKEQKKKVELQSQLDSFQSPPEQKVVDLGQFRQLLKRELDDQACQKAALQGLIDEIKVYVDRRMEVKFKISNSPTSPRLANPADRGKTGYSHCSSCTSY